MTEDTTKVLEELRGIVNSFVIRGSGVAGNLRNGYTVNPGSGQISSGSRGTPIPITSGACCPIAGDCFVSTQSICESGGGTYQGDNTTCDPNPCPTVDTGACCAEDDSCSITTEADCQGTYFGDDTTCSPNPCPSGDLCPSATVSFSFGCPNVPTCGGEDCTCPDHLLFVSGLTPTFTTPHCSFHLDGVIPDTSCTSQIIPPPPCTGITSSTLCSDNAGTWSIDYELDPITGNYTVTGTVTVADCGECCGFTHTQVATGTYVPFADDFFEEDFGDFCGIGPQLSTSIDVHFSA